MSEQYIPDNLIAGVGFPVTTDIVWIKEGQNLKRGALLGKDTNGKYSLSKTSSSDGSEIPHRILAEDIDATDEDKKAVVYKSGQFNARAIIFGEGHTAESVKDTLWKEGIEIRTDTAKA